MHDLLFLSLGITIGSLCTLALVALMRQAVDADEWDRLNDWDGGSGPYDQDGEDWTVRIRRTGE
jgi:hypothetical protein